MPTFQVDGILFDMDGTLIDSTPGVISAWKLFAQKYDLDLDKVLRESHGVRLVESLKTFCGIHDVSLLKEECRRFEDEVIKGGPVALPGARALLEKLNQSEESRARWTIVTSATSVYSSQALEAASLPLPPTLVASEHIQRGKPAPDPYLEGAHRLGLDPTKVLVVEDAPSGIRSGNAAGARTLAVLTSHEREALEQAAPDHVVSTLTDVQIEWNEGQFTISL